MRCVGCGHVTGDVAGSASGRLGIGRCIVCGREGVISRELAFRWRLGGGGREVGLCVEFIGGEGLGERYRGGGSCR